MALVITIAQRKGGAGKTTLACQLAAALAQDGARVVGVDMDEQASFSSWLENRPDDAAPMEMVGARSAAGRTASGLLIGAKRGADYVIVDTPPSTHYSVKSAIREADIVLTPIQLSPIDLEATYPTAQLIGDANARALFVINRAPPRAKIADRIRDESLKSGLPLARAELGNRAVYAESFAAGLGVTEFAPSSKAAHELTALLHEVRDFSGAALAAQ